MIKASDNGHTETVKTLFRSVLTVSVYPCRDALKKTVRLLYDNITAASESGQVTENQNKAFPKIFLLISR